MSYTFFKPEDIVTIIEFWNMPPHLETSIEIAISARQIGSHVDYLHWGNDACYNECYIRKEKSLPRERKLLELARGEINVKYTGLESWREYHLDLAPFLKSSSHLKRLTFEGHNLGALLFANLCNMTKDGQPTVKRHAELLSSMANTYIDVYKSFEKYIRKTKPSKVVLFNGRFICPAAIEAVCRKHSIETIYHERGGSNYKYMLSSKPVHNLYQFQEILKRTWLEKKISDEEALIIGKQIFEDRLRGINTEGPSFVTQFSECIKKEANKRIISFFSTSDDEINCVANPLEFPKSAWENQVTAALSLAGAINSNRNVHLYIRLHPNLASKPRSAIKEWMQLCWPINCSIILPESQINSYELVRVSEAVFTYGSTIGVEAVALGVTSYSLGPSLGDYLESLISISSQSELDTIVCKILAEEKQKIEKTRDAYMFFYACSSFGVPYIYYLPDGFSGGRFMGVEFKI